MASIASLVVSIGADTSGLMRGFATAEGRMASFASGAARFAGAAFLGTGAAVAAGLAISVKQAGDLEQAVANIASINPSINTAEVFDALSQMSTRVPQSATQLGNALYNIFSSIDIGQADALSLTEVFAKGATGAQTDAQTFGTAILGIMNAYKLSVADAAHISDVFFNTVNRGVVTGPELAASLGLVTGVAKTAGVDLDTLGGLIVGVTKEGGPAAQNINNLANFLAKFNSTDAIKGFNALGVSLVGAGGKFRPITDILADAKKKLDAMAPAARSAAISKIFQDFQARAGFITLMSQLDNVNGAIGENRTSVGAADAAYSRMSRTFNTQWALMLNTLASIAQAIGAELIPAIMPLLIAFRETLPQIFEAGKAAIATFTVDVGALGIVLANIRKWFGDTVADGIEPFFQAFMYGGWGGLASLIGQRLLQVLGAAWAGITSFLAQKWSEIDWNAVFASMGAFAASAATWIGNLWASIDWNAVLSATGSFADALGGFLLEQWNRIDWGAIGKGAGSGFRDFMILQISTALDALDLGGIMTKKTAGIDWLTLGLNVGMGSNDFVTGLVSSFFDAKAWEPLMNKLNEKGREGGMAFLRGMVDLYTFGSLGKYQTLVDLLRHALDLPEPNGSTGGSGGFVPTPTSLSMMPGAGRPQAPITVEVNIESITGEADENRLVTKVIAALRAAQQEVLGTPPPTPQLAGTFV